jgi:hypothetical protein
MRNFARVNGLFFSKQIFWEKEAKDHFARKCVEYGRRRVVGFSGNRSGLTFRCIGSVSRVAAAALSIQSDLL